MKRSTTDGGGKDSKKQRTTTTRTQQIFGGVDVDVRESSIGKEAGKGLFVRHGQGIMQGPILNEKGGFEDINETIAKVQEALEAFEGRDLSTCAGATTSIFRLKEQLQTLKHLKNQLWPHIKSFFPQAKRKGKNGLKMHMAGDALFTMSGDLYGIRDLLQRKILGFYLKSHSTLHCVHKTTLREHIFRGEEYLRVTNPQMYCVEWMEFSFENIIKEGKEAAGQVGKEEMVQRGLSAQKVDTFLQRSIILRGSDPNDLFAIGVGGGSELYHIVSRAQLEKWWHKKINIETKCLVSNGTSIMTYMNTLLGEEAIHNNVNFLPILAVNETQDDRPLHMVGVLCRALRTINPETGDGDPELFANYGRPYHEGLMEECLKKKMV